jgi:hypothetical protein
VLFYGECDELAGFTYAGVFFRLGYRGGSSAMLWGLRQALRLKLREPLTLVAYCTRSSSPAVYRLLASLMPDIYPSRRGILVCLGRDVDSRGERPSRSDHFSTETQLGDYSS